MESQQVCAAICANSKLLTVFLFLANINVDLTTPLFAFLKTGVFWGLIWVNDPSEKFDDQSCGFVVIFRVLN